MLTSLAMGVGPVHEPGRDCRRIVAPAPGPTMTVLTPGVLVPALLVAAAVVVVAGLPGPGPLRLDRLRLRGGPGAARSADPPVAGGTPRAAAGGPTAGGQETGLRNAAQPTRIGAAVAGRWPPPRQAAVALAGAAVGALALGPVVVLVALVAAAALRRTLARRLVTAAAYQERLHAVDACAALAAELRAGRVPSDALDSAAALARGAMQEALHGAAAGGRLGGDVPTALMAAATGPTAVPEVLRGLAACWQVCSQAGTGLAAAVDRLAEGLRARQVQQRAVAAALAGPRASASMLALLPLAGIALGAGLGARPFDVLLRTPLGLGCLVLGVALDLAGLWWTGRIVARAAAG